MSYVKVDKYNAICESIAQTMLDPQHVTIL
jgi:hypothetical protein